MLNADLQSAAEAFIATVQHAQEYGVYVRAHTAFQDDDAGDIAGVQPVNQSGIGIRFRFGGGSSILLWIAG